jgi:hypothetical protein
MVGVTIPRAHFRHPTFVARGLNPTELLFYRGIDENPFDLRLLSRCPDESYVGRTPLSTIDIFAVRGNQIDSDNLVALFLAQYTIGHWHEPNVDIQPDLVAFMSKRKRTAARLSHVANQNSVPTRRFGSQGSEPFQEFY